MKCVLIAVFAVSFLAACQPVAAVPTITAPAATATGDPQVEVRAVVESFGQHLQNVPVQGDNLPLLILQEYGKFVSPDLLELWLADPTEVPGRLTSSPWPDHIEIDSIVQQDANTYLVTGSVIELTSNEVANGGVADQYPVSLTARKIGQSWLITQYSQTLNP